MKKEALVPENFKKIISQGGGDPFSFCKTESDEIVDSFQQREKFRTQTSWHIPSQELIDLMRKYGPLVSVGSGHGYTESLAILQGVDVVSTDIEPTDKNKWCRGSSFYCDIEKIEASEAVWKYRERNAFMAWPPYNNPMAYEVALFMEKGRTLIYIGESDGGCTGDSKFFNLLESEFEEIDSISIPKWWGIHDYCTVYRKIK